MAKRRIVLTDTLIDEIVRKIDGLPPGAILTLEHDAFLTSEPDKPQFKVEETTARQKLKAWAKFTLGLLLAGNPVLGWARLVLLVLIAAANIWKLVHG